MTTLDGERQDQAMREPETATAPGGAQTSEQDAAGTGRRRRRLSAVVLLLAIVFAAGAAFAYRGLAQDGQARATASASDPSTFGSVRAPEAGDPSAPQTEGGIIVETPSEARESEETATAANGAGDSEAKLGPQGYAPYSSAETNILLLGSDSRTTQGNPAAWAYDDARSDVMLLVQVSADASAATVMSFPRNLAAPVAGSDGLTLINTGYARAGIEGARAAVQDLTGIRVDHVAVTDFQAFRDIIDELGGITLTSRQEGTQVYDGRGALKWMRERKTLPHDDLDRVRRHQAFLQAFHSQFLAGAAADPGTAQTIYGVLRRHAAVDASLAEAEALGLAMRLAAISPQSILYVTFPYADTVRDANGYFMLNPDWAQAAPLVQAFRSGEAYEYVASHVLEKLDARPVE